MNLNEAQIRSVVEEVVRTLAPDPQAPAVVSSRARTGGNGDDGIFERLDGAIDAAGAAQRELEALGDDSLQIEDVEDNTSIITVKTDDVSPNNKLNFHRTLWNLTL